MRRNPHRDDKGYERGPFRIEQLRKGGRSRWRISEDVGSGWEYRGTVDSREEAEGAIGEKYPGAEIVYAYANASPGYSDEFREGAAKAYWADAYASEVEEADAEDELGPGAGGDWMDVLPETPPSAYEAAEKLERELVSESGYGSLNDLVQAAADADGVVAEDVDIEDLGHYMAMSAMGHGVAWEDDHEKFHYANIDLEAYAVRDDAYAAVQEELGEEDG